MWTPGSAAEQPRWMVDALHAPCLEPALKRLQGAGALAAMQAAAAVVEALPVQRPAGMEAGPFSELHADAISLVSQSCSGMISQVLAARATASGGGSGASAAAPASSSSDLQDAAWRVLALVPKLAATIQTLADEPEASTALPSGHGAWLAQLNGQYCANFCRLLQLLATLKDPPAQQLSTWAAAATAGLRLQPVLLQLKASLRQIEAQPESGTAARGFVVLSWELMQNLLSTARLHIAAMESGSNAGMFSSLQAAQLLFLWELHSTAAQLCHLLITRGSPALAGWHELESKYGPTMCWGQLLDCLDGIFARASAAMRAQVDSHSNRGNASLAE